MVSIDKCVNYVDLSTYHHLDADIYMFRFANFGKLFHKVSIHNALVIHTLFSQLAEPCCFVEFSTDFRCRYIWLIVYTKCFSFVMQKCAFIYIIKYFYDALNQVKLSGLHTCCYNYCFLFMCFLIYCVFKECSKCLLQGVIGKCSDKCFEVTSTTWESSVYKRVLGTTTAGGQLPLLILFSYIYLSTTVFSYPL